MEDDTKIGMLYFGLMILIMLIIGFTLYCIITSLETSYIVIEGEVINSEAILKDNGELKYLLVTFDNNESYKIEIRDDIDLTVNSRLIIELGNTGTRFWVWDDYYYDDVYYIHNVVKVPENL